MRVLFSMLLLVGFAVGAAEPTQTFTDDLNRKVVVPVHPKRIVSLHDLDITIPLIELGVPPVAPSMGASAGAGASADGIAVSQDSSVHWDAA